jgi:hypothetical protein
MTGKPGRWPRWLRRSVAAAVAVLLLAGVGAIGWRVLRPSDSMDRSGGPYPSMRAFGIPDEYAIMPKMPLILDGRLRVFAEKRRVWVDADVTARHPLNPYWAYRRWPAQLVGVAGVSPADPGGSPLVLARWSDGVVTALDARAGRVLWQKRITPEYPAGYIGRRTGARTLYEPPGLYTASSPAGDPVLVVDGNGEAAGYDAASGRQLWAHRPGCAADSWTGVTMYLARCGDRIDILDAATGQPRGTLTGQAPQPWGCTAGRSGCRMVTIRDGANARIGRDGSVKPAPAARSAADFLVDDGYVEWREDSYVGVVDAQTGSYRWQLPLKGWVLGADATRVYVLTSRHRLVVLDAADGTKRSEGGIPAGRPWYPGYVHIRDGFVAMERLQGQPQADDDSYYYSAQQSAVVAQT